MRVCATFTLLALLVGCGEKAGQPETDTTSTAASASETSTMADNSTAPAGTVSDVPPADKEFSAKAGGANLAEIQMGQLALQNASRADVKAYAQRMVTDHTAAGNKLEAIATAKGLALPTEISGDAKAGYEHLSSLSGEEFDKAYIGHMVEDHQKAESLFSTEATNGGDPDLKGFAAETLPTIQEHLRLARALSSRSP